MRVYRRCLVAFLRCLLLLSRRTALKIVPPDLQTAFARAQHLRHGINASDWFSQNRKGLLCARTPTATHDAADIALMAKLGFDNVRLSIDPAPLEQYPRGSRWPECRFHRAPRSRASTQCWPTAWRCKIDLHPEEPYKQRSSHQQPCGRSLRALWRPSGCALRQPRSGARLLRDHERARRERSRIAGLAIQARAAAAIREAAPRNTIIATGPN